MFSISQGTVSFQIQSVSDGWKSGSMERADRTGFDASRKCDDINFYPLKRGLSFRRTSPKGMLGMPLSKILFQSFPLTVSVLTWTKYYCNVMKSFYYTGPLASTTETTSTPGQCQSCYPWPKLVWQPRSTPRWSLALIDTLPSAVRRLWVRCLIM